LFKRKIQVKKSLVPPGRGAFLRGIDFAAQVAVAEFNSGLADTFRQAHVTTRKNVRMLG